MVSTRRSRFPDFQTSVLQIGEDTDSNIDHVSVASVIAVAVTEESASLSE